jgi:hypothetical protein
MIRNDLKFQPIQKPMLVRALLFLKEFMIPRRTIRS